jgi:DNA-binding transcriptional LysR family regulator
VDKFVSMEIFVAVVEAGSLTAAAERYEISSAMVGKHIRSLETRLAARLLTRTTRRQSLTEIGRQYYEQCRRATRHPSHPRECADTARSIDDQSPSDSDDAWSG